MAIQTTFKRYEMKYLLTWQQKQRMLLAMRPYMKLDEYGHSTIRNIYLDTPDYRLIRRSLEKPVYKEKLRIRSYKQVEPEDPIFVELKKKYDSVVYKRRLTVTDGQARESFERNLPLLGKQEKATAAANGNRSQAQIGEEIEYFRSYYGALKPAVFLSYEREAFYEISGGDFRVTFDENILFRDYDFSLGSEIYGSPLLAEGQFLMEVKTSGGLPLWMCNILTELGVYKTSFSKYGAAYRKMMCGEAQNYTNTKQLKSNRSNFEYFERKNINQQDSKQLNNLVREKERNTRYA